jgi:exodeoxyribonuclease-3
MKIISWNVNGVRAVERKGELENILSTPNLDFLFIQEIKSKPENLSEIEEKYSKDWIISWHSAEKPGYAGTGIFIRRTENFQNLVIKTGMDNFSDTEGRIIQADFSQENINYSLLGVYFPNGGKSPLAWQEKLVFYDLFLDYVNLLRSSGKVVIWTGDINCAHNEIDLSHPKRNMKSIGFLPEERAWISKVIKNNWCDVWREKFPTKIETYSWWSFISGARERNVGWRIDYFFIDTKMLPQVKTISYLGKQFGSDHCPVLLEI